MSTCDISKHEGSISIFEHLMTEFHELPEQPSYLKLCSPSGKDRMHDGIKDGSHIDLNMFLTGWL